MNNKQMLDELYRDGWGVRVEQFSHGWSATAQKINRAGAVVFSQESKGAAITQLYNLIKDQDWRHER